MDIVKYNTIVKLRQEHKDWSNAAIAKIVGITRERVRQVLKENNLKTKRVSPRIHTCPTCLKSINTKSLYCNSECRSSIKYNKYVCINCKKEFTRLKRVVNREAKKAMQANRQLKLYCSKTCFENQFKI